MLEQLPGLLASEAAAAAAVWAVSVRARAESRSLQVHHISAASPPATSLSTPARLRALSAWRATPSSVDVGASGVPLLPLCASFHHRHLLQAAHHRRRRASPTPGPAESGASLPLCARLWAYLPHTTLCRCYSRTPTSTTTSSCRKRSLHVAGTSGSIPSQFTSNVETASSFSRTLTSGNTNKRAR